jgi:hypothetical protein
MRVKPLKEVSGGRLEENEGPRIKRISKPYHNFKN